MIEVVKLTHEHVLKFVPVEGLGMDLYEFRKMLIRIMDSVQNTCLALVSRGEVVAVAGVTYVAEHSMEFWSMPSPLVERMKKSYASTIKRACHTLMHEVSAHRFIVAIEQDRPEWIKWAEFLGFEFECFAKGYCPSGKSAWIFTKVIPKWPQE